MEKGRSKVKREATLEIARVMLQRDLKRQTIMKMTDFSSDDLASIQHPASSIQHPASSIKSLRMRPDDNFSLQGK